MFTVEIAWFQFDLPDHASIQAITDTANPLFPEARVTTRWIVALERFEMSLHLSAAQNLTDLSRLAFDDAHSGLTPIPFNQNGIPAMRYGAYDRDRTQIDWWFHLIGLTLSIRLKAKAFPKTLPTDAEHHEHEKIIASVRRVMPSD